MPDSQVRVLEDEPIGVISPRLYGQFAEHLGRCCYDGLWVGPDSTIPNIDGFRTDVVEALKAMPTTMLRWPGGCYADHYHWQDDIGPAKERPVRLGLSCGLKSVDDNALGTHEFLQLCRLVRAEPYLAGNMGSGSVQEMCDWVEYCNTSLPTSLAQNRAANGAPEPFGVRLWGVGNENWGCGGNYSPEGYGLEYRRYATMLRDVDPGAELVVCGHTPEWNERLIATLKDHGGLIDHFSIHRYWIGAGPGSNFNEADYYRGLKEAEETEGAIEEARLMLTEVDLNGRIGIALDEWGVWHPEARPWGPGAVADVSGEYAQATTLRDAIMAAVALEVFHRQCRSLSLANLAQVVNVLHAPIQTSGEAMWLTPTYYLFQLHGPHIGQTALRTEVEGPKLPNGTCSVSATASAGASRALTIINRHMSESASVALPSWAIQGCILTAQEPNAANIIEDPYQVTLAPATPANATIEIPPHSVVTLTE